MEGAGPCSLRRGAVARRHPEALPGRTRRPDAGRREPVLPAADGDAPSRRVRAAATLVGVRPRSDGLGPVGRPRGKSPAHRGLQESVPVATTHEPEVNEHEPGPVVVQSDAGGSEPTTVPAPDLPVWFVVGLTAT